MGNRLRTIHDKQAQAAAAAGQLRRGPVRARPHLGDADKAIARDELRRILEHAARLASHEARRGLRGPRTRDLLLLELLASTGLRASEAARLEVRDVVLEGEPYVRVRGGKKRRPAQVDTVPLTQRLARELASWCRGLEPRAPLFGHAGDAAAPIDRRAVWAIVKRYLRAVGARAVLNVHSLRHRFLTDLASAAGANPFDVAKLGRLRRMDTVLEYFGASQTRAAVEALPLPWPARRTAPYRRRK